MKGILLIAAVIIAAVTLSQAATRQPSAHGQFWDIHAYEQATHHRRAPGSVTATPATERSERRGRERSGGA